MTLGQVVRVPTADGTTRKAYSFRSASQVNWPEAVTVRSDALSLSKAEEPVAGSKEVEKLELAAGYPPNNHIVRCAFCVSYPTLRVNFRFHLVTYNCKL